LVSTTRHFTNLLPFHDLAHFKTTALVGSLSDETNTTTAHAHQVTATALFFNSSRFADLVSKFFEVKQVVARDHELQGPAYQSIGFSVFGNFTDGEWREAECDEAHHRVAEAAEGSLLPVSHF